MSHSELPDQYLRAADAIRDAAADDPDEQAFLDAAARHLAEGTGASSLGIIVSSPHDDEFRVRACWPAVTGDDAVATAESLLRPDDPSVLWMPFVDGDDVAGFVSLKDERERRDDEQMQFLAHVDSLVRTFERSWATVQIGYRYRVAVAAIEDGLFNYILDSDGSRTYIFATDQFEGLFGRAKRAMIGPDAEPDWFADGLDEEGQRLLDEHNAQLGAGKSARTVFRYLRRDGEIRWLREDATPQRESSGRLTVTGIVTDVTEQKLAEELKDIAREAAEAESERKTAFIATVSHELRTPLGTVHGFAEMLRRELDELQDGASNDRLIEFVEAIEERSGDLLRVVEDLVDLSNLESGRLTLASARLDVVEIVDRVGGDYALAGVSIVNPGAPVVALGDPLRVARIVERVTANAVKFGRGAGIEISVRVDDGEAVVEVRDAGVGMSAEQMERIFEPFTQVDDRLNRSYDGTGIGLTVARRLAIAMGGDIEVDSQLGVGTTVRLRLPAAGGRTAAEDRGTSQPEVTARKGRGKDSIS